MPKMKTRKAINKRIKITGTGKIMRVAKTRGKEAKRRKNRTYNTQVVMATGNRRQLKRMTPGVRNPD